MVVIPKYLEIAAFSYSCSCNYYCLYFFKKSKYGVAMRATSFDQEAALAQGINVGRIFGLVWFIAGMLGCFCRVSLLQVDLILYLN